MVFDGAVDDAAIAAMVKWNINSVRIPLNEDCWLGINGVADASSGANYQNAIADYVTRLHKAGLYAIVELHWSAPGTFLANGTPKQPAPDADHSPAFWSSVADRFKSDPMIVFDLYNEPFVSNTTPVNSKNNMANTSADPWTCWRDGCTITSAKGITGSWQSAGMQTLLDAVRATGAEQLVMVGGLNYANDLSLWRYYRPHDPLCNVAAAYHQYDDASCNNEACWEFFLTQISRTYPLITGELGEYDCQHGFLDTYVAWADKHRISYLAWAWNQADCGGFPASSNATTVRRATSASATAITCSRPAPDLTGPSHFGKRPCAIVEAMYAARCTAFLALATCVSCGARTPLDAGDI